MDFATFPKVELHVHLDCSLSYKVVSKIDPSISKQTYESEFIAPPHCKDLADFLTRAIKGISLMQTEENLRLVTIDLFEQFKQDNVIYAEIRFAPFEHIRKGLTPHQVVQTINDTVEQCKKDFDIEARIILCTLRHFPEDISMATIKLVEEFQGSNVVGFDIASDEAGSPIDAHVKAFQYAYEKEIPCTAHAGEALGSDSIWETIDEFKPKRIGHGVRCTEDPNLMEYLKEEKYHLEICPTSNIQTNIYKNFRHHAINKIYDFGISCGVNTDTRTITNITLNEEYRKLHQTFQWDKAKYLHCNLEAIKHAFLPEEKKIALRMKIWKGYR